MAIRLACLIWLARDHGHEGGLVAIGQVHHAKGCDHLMVQALYGGVDFVILVALEDFFGFH